VGLSGTAPAGSSDLSIVTVCMNRREHLLRSAAAVSRWPHHGEHLIVDWSSREPLRRDQLPADPRLRLVRVEGESRWNLCRAYNFAIARARGPWILKLDADCWPSSRFDPTALVGEPGTAGAEPAERIWAFGSGPEGRKGQFLMHRHLFQAVGGFNEYLTGYGFDDKDLQARLRLHSGGDLLPIPSDWLAVIPHSDEERAEQGRAGGMRPLRSSLGLATMRASRLSNRLLAAHYPWGKGSPASRYEPVTATARAPGTKADELWRVDPDSVPRPSPETADEIDHARRMTFWGCFLAIPEIFLEVMPFKLFPLPRQGRWPVRWWHRLYWYTGRQLLQVPVLLLSLGRGALTRTAVLLGLRAASTSR
jgi:hypothetical protein